MFVDITKFICGSAELVHKMLRRRYVVKHNLITEVYLMTVMETTTCFGLCWPSSVVFGYIPSPSFTHTTGMTHFLDKMLRL